MEQRLASELLTIWRRVLGHPELDADSNFFDLGGNETDATKIFDEIALLCERRILPATIYRAPTVARLASLLEQGDIRLPALTLLRPGRTDPPILITHGSGGSILEFCRLLPHIRSQRAIYGLQAKGLDETDEAFERIEETAEVFLEAVRQVQPHGPYLLIGSSLGGLVTLEMAQRLMANGEEIKLLLMLETYPARRHLAVSARAQLYTRLVLHHIRASRKLSFRRGAGYLLDRAKYHFPFQRRNETGNGRAPHEGANKHAFERASAALENYDPRPYRGKIHFVRAAIRLQFPDDPAAVWSKWAPDIEVKTVPGDHDGILSHNAEELGAVISQYLNEVDSPTNHERR